MQEPHLFKYNKSGPASQQYQNANLSDMDAKPTDQDFDDHDRSDPILACRRRSRSMWLHFPHLELLFLFWAFEGAVAAQVSALKNAECAHVFWLALAALVGSRFRRLIPAWIEASCDSRLVPLNMPGSRVCFRISCGEQSKQRCRPSVHAPFQ